MRSEEGRGAEYALKAWGEEKAAVEAAAAAAEAWDEARAATVSAKEKEKKLWRAAVKAAQAADLAISASRAAGNHVTPPRAEKMGDWEGILLPPGAHGPGINPAEDDIEVLVSFFSCTAAAAVKKCAKDELEDELERASIAWASVLRCIRRSQGKPPCEDEREAARRRRLGMKAK